MPAVLTGPFAAAALVLAGAGVAKLRSPDAAARAALGLGMPAARPLVRAFAAVELTVALWCLWRPGPWSAGVLTGLYAGFAALGVGLARRRAACGCFGADDEPVSNAHWLLSALLAAVGAAAAVWTPHSLGWAAARHPGVGAVLAVGVAGAAYALVLVYRQLPMAWNAWSGR